MNRLLLFLAGPIFLGASVFAGCTDISDDGARELILGRSELTLNANTTGLFLIKQGNRPYSVECADENIASAYISSERTNAVYVKAIRSGQTSVTVSDGKGKTASVALTVLSNPIELTLDTDTDGFEIITGKTRVVEIMTGNGGYAVTSSVPGTVSATLNPSNDEQIFFKGLQEGSAMVSITDMEGESIEFTIEVKNVASIKLPDYELTVAAGASKQIPIQYGNGGYTVSSSSESIAEAEIVASNVRITGVAEGSTTVTVSDAAGQTAEIAVSVYIAPWAARLHTTYFQVPNFEEDEKYSALETVSFEAFVCIDQAGMLNSIMGLEGTFLLRQNGGKYNLYTLDGELKSETSVKYGEWAYVAATFDGIGKTARLYVNGVLEDELDLRSSTVDLGRTAGVQKPELEHFMVGMACESSRYLYGSIGEIRVWDKVLTEEEILQNNKSISVDPAAEHLIAYWKLNENTDLMEVPDYSGNGNIGIPSEVINQWSPLAYP